jgi:hypothetical protein
MQQPNVQESMSLCRSHLAICELTIGFSVAVRTSWDSLNDSRRKGGLLLKRIQSHKTCLSKHSVIEGVCFLRSTFKLPSDYEDGRTILDHDDVTFSSLTSVHLPCY